MYPTKDPYTGDEKKKHIYDTLKMRNWPRFKYLKKMWPPDRNGEIACRVPYEKKVISWKKMTLERDIRGGEQWHFPYLLPLCASVKWNKKKFEIPPSWKLKLGKRKWGRKNSYLSWGGEKSVPLPPAHAIVAFYPQKSGHWLSTNPKEKKNLHFPPLPPPLERNKFLFFPFFPCVC